jgi:hypothetical protein
MTDPTSSDDVEPGLVEYRVPGPAWRSPGPAEEDRLVPRPRSERAPISDLLGKWGGDPDDGFDEWLAEERRAPQSRWPR